MTARVWITLTILLCKILIWKYDNVHWPIFYNRRHCVCTLLDCEQCDHMARLFYLFGHDSYNVPKCPKIGQIGFKISSNTKLSIKNAQRLLTLVLSGEISPNLVTLRPVSLHLKAETSHRDNFVIIVVLPTIDWLIENQLAVQALHSEIR